MTTEREPYREPDEAPSTPVEIGLHLAKLGREMQTVTDELKRAMRAAVYARRDFRVAYARAFLSATGAMPARTQRAIEITADEWLAVELADELVGTHRAVIHSLDKRIDIGQSYGSIMRAAMALTNYGT